MRADLSHRTAVVFFSVCGDGALLLVTLDEQGDRDQKRTTGTPLLSMAR